MGALQEDAHRDDMAEIEHAAAGRPRENRQIDPHGIPPGLQLDGHLRAIGVPRVVAVVGAQPYGAAAPPFQVDVQREALKAAFPMGICMITEGVIPIAARDLLRVVGSCVVASAVAGGLIMVWGVESPVPHGGMFVVPLFTHPLLFCLALGIGTVICGVMLSLWKKPVTERDEEFDELSDQKLKDEEITFTLE